MVGPEQVDLDAERREGGAPLVVVEGPEIGGHPSAPRLYLHQLLARHSTCFPLRQLPGPLGFERASLGGK